MAGCAARGGLANFNLSPDKIVPFRLDVPYQGAFHRSVAKLLLLATEIKNAPVTSALRNHWRCPKLAVATDSNRSRRYGMDPARPAHAAFHRN
jgi:hypothetical protein